MGYPIAATTIRCYIEVGLLWREYFKLKYIFYLLAIPLLFVVAYKSATYERSIVLVLGLVGSGILLILNLIKTVYYDAVLDTKRKGSQE